MIKIHKEPFIIITNDDGINSVGLKKAVTLVKKFTSNFIVVAPEGNCSGFSHSITLSKPVRLTKISNRYYTCDGTPTDCIMLCLSELLKKRKPDLIISGINIGENLGDDVIYSGTVGAALEGALSGIKSISISKLRSIDGERDYWSSANKYLIKIIKLFFNSKSQNFCLNINVPNLRYKDIRGVKVVKLARRKPIGKYIVRKDSKGIPYYWLTTDRTIKKIEDDTDLWAINKNFISITPIDIDMTNYKFINKKDDENY